MGAFRKRARGGAELQPKIPKFLREFADWLLELSFRSVARVKKQYVDIGIREEPATAETTQRNQREVHRTIRFGGDKFLPKALHDGFNQGSAAQQSRAAGACADKLISDARIFLRGKITQLCNK